MSAKLFHPQNSGSPIHLFLEKLYLDLSSIEGGNVADYIPELTRSKPDWLGIVIATVDGHVYQVGDSREKFTIQSISKAITYGLALEDRGLNAVLEKVGVEPSGEAFNSISLEQGSGRPMNPMINAGAIATTGLIRETDDKDRMARILDKFSKFIGYQVDIDEQVYLSEKETGHRNRAIAHLLLGYGILDRSPEEILDLYFRQCSILVDARALALMGACLANNGVNPITSVAALKSEYVEKVLSVMSTCGMYDFSGGWIFNVGMPAKSGVGGGIMAVLPGQFGLGVFSPPLDEKGNSLRGIIACERVSSYFKLHLFNVAKSVSASVIRMADTGQNIRSRRSRNDTEVSVLDRKGHTIHLYELQGELMFGASESIVQQICSSLDNIDFVIFDMKRVFEINEAATLIFEDMTEMLLEKGKSIFFTHIDHNYQFMRRINKLNQNNDKLSYFSFSDTDRALEWCENRILLKDQGNNESFLLIKKSLAEQFLCTDLNEQELEYLETSANHVQFHEGDYICRNGEQADSMFFILQGEVEVAVQAAGKHNVRLRSIGSGMCFGEVSLVSGNIRSADIIALTETECLEVPFSILEGEIKTKILINLATHLALKVKNDTRLLQETS